MNKSIIPLPQHQPLEGTVIFPEDAQPSLEESLEQFARNCEIAANAFMLAAAEAFRPLIEEFAKSEAIQTLIRETENYDPLAEARKRNRDDLNKKRRQLRRNKGRL